jgi:GntR family transcriptional repressor for pyruvate dehydrogenase complex
LADKGATPGSALRSELDRQQRLLRPVYVPAATEVVCDHLQSLVLDGTLRPGEKLPAEPDLARMLRVGRSTIREAKKTLAARGLIESRGKQGTFVAPPPRDPTRLASLGELLADPALPDLHQTRQIVEVGALRIAALRATASDIAQLHSTLDRIAEDIDNGAADVADRLVGFHRNLVKASHNKVLVSVYDLIAHLLREHQLPFYPTVVQLHEEVESHRRLVEALASRNTDAATAAMHEHLDESEDLRLDALREVEADP